MRPKTGQSGDCSALLVTAQFLAESDKLEGRSILVCAIGRGFQDGFAIEMATILAPGVIQSWRLRDVDLAIQGFGIHDFSLAGGLVEDRVG